jgi:hypothetical protein
VDEEFQRVDGQCWNSSSITLIGAMAPGLSSSRRELLARTLHRKPCMLLKDKATPSLDLDKKQEVKRAHSDLSRNLSRGSAVSMDKDPEADCNGSEFLLAELDDDPLEFLRGSGLFLHHETFIGFRGSMQTDPGDQQRDTTWQ